MNDDSEFLLLNTIFELNQRKADICQRDLSKATNLSLGMTNTLLRRLEEKGFIQVKKESPKRVLYLITENGTQALAGKNCGYLRQIVKSIGAYKDRLIDRTNDAVNKGFTGIAVLGSSDFSFLVEYAALHEGVSFGTFPKDTVIPENTFVFIAEDYAESCSVAKDSCAQLYDVLVGEGL
jgi:DNA-binding MarR family transcriptional regulator